MDLYRKHGVNPLGGCLPLFVQMPIFIGLYWSLYLSVNLRLSAFLYIDNLAAPDHLFRWGNNVPILSSILGPYLNLLPIITVILFVVQQKMFTPPAMDEQAAMQQKIMSYMMIFIGYMFYRVPSGLCLYFIASSLWGVAEKKLMPKPSMSPVTPPPPERRKKKDKPLSGTRR
jgi:YidC/Oxa1 family membrane protein insertase